MVATWYFIFRLEKVFRLNEHRQQHTARFHCYLDSHLGEILLDRPENKFNNKHMKVISMIESNACLVSLNLNVVFIDSPSAKIFPDIASPNIYFITL